MVIYALRTVLSRPGSVAVHLPRRAAVTLVSSAVIGCCALIPSVLVAGSRLQSAAQSGIRMLQPSTTIGEQHLPESEVRN